MVFETPKNLCTGCTACVSVCPEQCIEMTSDEYGFWYPKIVAEEKCINCGRCNNACPVLKNNIREPVFDRKVLAAFARDPRIRSRSSSGGIFSILANRILEMGGVVYAAIYDENFSVRHSRIEKAEDLYKGCGAKYAQSQIAGIFSAVLRDLRAGRTILFSGTPCQIEGLQAFLNKEYILLICVDFVCHGVPSPLALKGYIQYLQRTFESPMNKINMRAKDTGWSHYSYSFVIDFQNGKKYSAKSSEDLFLQLFTGDYINRESCSDCKFKGIDRNSDITLADFWGVWDLYPEVDDNKGISALIIHTQKGYELFKKCENKMSSFNISVDDMCKWNPSLSSSSKAKKNRKKILQLAINGKFDRIRSLMFSSNLIKRFLVKH